MEALAPRSEAENFLSNNKIGAAAWDEKLQPIHDILFCETSPIPTKWALNAMGKIQNGIRLPLVWLSDGLHGGVRERLKEIGAL